MGTRSTRPWDEVSRTIKSSQVITSLQNLQQKRRCVEHVLERAFDYLLFSRSFRRPSHAVSTDSFVFFFPSAFRGLISVEQPRSPLGLRLGAEPSGAAVENLFSPFVRAKCGWQ